MHKVLFYAKDLRKRRTHGKLETLLDYRESNVRNIKIHYCFDKLKVKLL